MLIPSIMFFGALIGLVMLGLVGLVMYMRELDEHDRRPVPPRPLTWAERIEQEEQSIAERHRANLRHLKAKAREEVIRLAQEQRRQQSTIYKNSRRDS